MLSCIPVPDVHGPAGSVGTAEDWEYAMSPKKQPTTAKRARATAREGGKYTTALRDAAVADNPTGAESAAAELIVAGLTDLVRRGTWVPVRVIEPENPRPRPDFAVSRTWGVVEAAVDGYVVRELSWGESHGTGRDNPRRPRVPVPYLNAKGDIEVAQVPPLAWADESSCWRWVFAHTGWALDTPGRIIDAAGQLAPSMDLPFEVRAFQRTGREGEVYGEDYTGSPSWWATIGWCAEDSDARELADALISNDSSTTRIQVWEHDRHTFSTVRYQRDAEPDRIPLPRRPFGAAVSGRPDAPGPECTTEPAWNAAVADGARPKYALHVWTGQQWRVISWHTGRTWAAIAADRLRVGVDGGPYAFGYVCGPHYPRAWAHDWTQHGRSCSDLVPSAATAEWLDREHMNRVLG